MLVTARVLKWLDGEIQTRLWPKDDHEGQKVRDAGHDPSQVLTTKDLVRGDNVFFCATGITDGALLRGVHYRANRCTTQSIVMRSKSGTVRMIEGEHKLSKLREFADIDFGKEGDTPRHGLLP